MSASSAPPDGAGEPLDPVGLHRVLPVRPGVRTLVDRAVVGHGPRVDVDDGLAVPVDDQPVAVGDLADHGGQHVPLAADGHERVDVAGLDDRHHPFLGLAHQDLLGAQRGVPQRYDVEVDVHAAVTGRGQLGGGAGDAGRAEVLDAGDQLRGEQLEGALDQQLLHERVADLHGRALRGTALPGGRPVAGRLEGLRGQDGGAADAVAAGRGAVQDGLVADPGGLGQVQVLVPEHADAEGVDQRVAGVGGVEDDLAADVGQTEAVAVAADPGHHPGQHPGRVGGVQRAEAERIHHPDRAGTHGQDVADDAADPGGRALVGLHVGRVVVRLDLEGDGVALTDVDHAGVLADAGQQLADRGLLGQLTERAQVHLGRLVRAVLRPHHRVHGQLGPGRTAVQDLADAEVLVLLQPELGPGLRLIGSGSCVLDGVGHAPTLPGCGRVVRPEISV